MEEDILKRDRAIQALRHQILLERQSVEERFDEKLQTNQRLIEDARVKFDNLMKLNEDLRKENEAQSTKLIVLQ